MKMSHTTEIYGGNSKAFYLLMLFLKEEDELVKMEFICLAPEVDLFFS